ncbi:MAG: hypothetical protein QOJ19_4020, partial [Acidimicrobiia bacterium]|nr:hypothetical protein [Acidimicrobiia bacterium]
MSEAVARPITFSGKDGLRLSGEEWGSDNGR